MTTRRLAAILAADVVGYSRMMAADEAGTLARLRAARRDVVDPLVAENGGRIFKTTGDGLLAEFGSTFIPKTINALRTIFPAHFGLVRSIPIGACSSAD
jgi:class 3 adenylate cyclase